MPGENDDFNLDSAVSDIGAGLGFGDDDASDNATDPVVLDTAGNGEPLPDGVGAAPTAAPAGTEAPDTGTGSPPAAVSPTAAAPRTWRPEAAAQWAALPPDVQAEIHKREEDIFRGIEGYKADAAYGKTMQSVIAPYDAVMKQYNIDPVQQVSGLMQAHYTLALGTPEQKQALFQQLARDYSVDLSPLAERDNPYVDPEVLRLRQEMAAIKSETSTYRNERLATQKQAIETEVAQFANDPANVHFKDVVNDMAHLLQTNQAATVKEAYEKAVWTNPAIRAREIDRQQADKVSRAAKEAEVKAAAAKKALGANVRTSAKSGGAAAPLGSMDDTIAATLASINARS